MITLTTPQEPTSRPWDAKNRLTWQSHHLSGGFFWGLRPCASSWLYSPLACVQGDYELVKRNELISLACQSIWSLFSMCQGWLRRLPWFVFRFWRLHSWMYCFSLASSLLSAWLIEPSSNSALELCLYVNCMSGRIWLILTFVKSKIHKLFLFLQVSRTKYKYWTYVNLKSEK